MLRVEIERIVYFRVSWPISTQYLFKFLCCIQGWCLYWQHGCEHAKSC